jgi:hypothetical protein
MYRFVTDSATQHDETMAFCEANGLDAKKIPDRDSFRINGDVIEYREFVTYGTAGLRANAYRLADEAAHLAGEARACHVHRQPRPQGRPVSVLDTIRAATPTRKAVSMCLDGALQAEWEKVQRSCPTSPTPPPTRSPAAPSTDIADRMDEVRDRFLASVVTFTFAADNLSWGEYLRMQAEHEPREGNALDRIRGYNTETFYPALIRKTCLTVSSADGEPEAVPDDVWDVLLGDGKKPRQPEPSSRSTS